MLSILFQEAVEQIDPNRVYIYDDDEEDVWMGYCWNCWLNTHSQGMFAREFDEFDFDELYEGSPEVSEDVRQNFLSYITQ